MSRTVDPTEIRDTTDCLAHLLTGLDLLQLGCQCAEQVTSPAALHVVVKKENA